MENKKDNKNEKNGGSKIKVAIIAIVILLLVGAGGYFGYNLFSNGKAQANKGVIKPQQQLPAQQLQTAQQQGPAQQSQQNISYLQQVVSAKTYGLDEFLVNLADEDGKRYLKVQVFVGYDNKKLDSELDEKKPILRDAVISILRTKKAADITSKGLDNIKMEMIQRINPVLTKGQLNNIYFNDILVQ